MILISVVVLGLISLQKLPLVFIPDIEHPQLHVRVSYPSSNPEEVEREISRPIEEVMGSLPNLESLRTDSGTSGAWISIEFTQGTDMSIASMEVRDRLDRVHDKLPEDLTSQPVIWRWSPSDIPIINFAVAWKGDPSIRDQVIENVVQKRILALNGVANIEIHGFHSKDIYVDLDKDLMRAYNINAYEIGRQIRRDNVDLPAGWVKAGGKKYNLRAIGSFESVGEIANLPINQRGLRLNQVANVRYALPDEHSFHRLNGTESISMEVSKISSASVLDVSRDVRQALEEIKSDPRYSDIEYHIWWDQADMIKDSISNLRKSGLIGGALAILVLLFFLGRFRNTLVIAMAIPVSIICALFIMYILRLEPFNKDISLNIITMMSMIYAVGIVVDPSIVVLENIFRKRSEEGLGAIESAVQGADQVWLALLASIGTNIIVFAPLIIFGGQGGSMRFAFDFGLVFCIVCVASLLIAFTLVPLLSARVMKNMSKGRERNFSGLKLFFLKLVSLSLRTRVVTVIIFIGMLAGMFILVKNIKHSGSNFTRERRMSFSVKVSHNYTYEEARDKMLEIEKRLLDSKKEFEISSVSMRLSMGGRNDGRVHVNFDPVKRDGHNTAELEEMIKKVLPETPGFTYRFGRRRGGQNQGIDIEIKGERMDMLEMYAERTRKLMETIPEVDDVDLSTEDGAQEIVVQVNRERAASAGLSAQMVASTVSANLSSRANSRFKADEREIDIQVGLHENDQVNLSTIGGLEMYSTSSSMRPELATVANITTARGPREIEKEDHLYTVEIYVNSTKGGLFKLGDEIKDKMSELPLAAGYSWNLGNDYEETRQEQKKFLFAIGLSLVLIYILLAALFESFIHPFTILLSVPFAMIGVILIFIVTRTNLDFMGYLGTIIVSGLVVNNGIILIDYINQLRAAGMNRRQAIYEGVAHRLRPILMTASTTILSLLPMTAPLLLPQVFGPAEGRAAMWGPVGLAILGGMTTSTFLTLIFTPTLYSIFDDLSEGTSKLFGRVFTAKKN